MGVLAILAASALVVLFTGSSSGADPAVTVGGLPDMGKITFTSGSTNQFAYAPGVDSTVAASTQSISNSNPNNGNCSATTPGFISVRGVKANKPACFGLLGFGDGPGGTPANSLNPNTDGSAGEALELKLAGPLAGFAFESFTLDIEANGVPIGAGGAAELNVEVRDAGGVLLQTIPVDLSQANRIPNDVVQNYRVPVTTIAAAGNTLVLRPVGSVRFQLEGDSVGNSVFTLTAVTDVLTCAPGDQATAGAATLTMVGGSCTPQPVYFSFNLDANQYSLLKNPSDAVFNMVVPWDDDLPYPGRVTQIDYLDGAGYQNMVWCDGDSAAPALPGDQIPSTPAVDGWCVAERHMTLEDGRQLTVETFYGLGDPRYK